MTDTTTNQPAPTDYSTPLSPQEQTQYQAWAKAGNKNPQDEEQDYDLPGYFKSGGVIPESGHLPDTFKKPNHPTFSTGSMYHGVGGNEGGTWAQNPDQTWNFTAGRTNMEHWGPQGLQQYFNKYEPGNRLIIPEQY